jgi:undecaprenyl-diphosphatase
MVVFAFPVLLLAWAIRQRTSPVLAFDHQAITAATDFTRGRRLVSLALVVQAVSQPWVVYTFATLIAAYVWFRQGLRARALWAFVTMMVGWAVGAAAKVVVHRLRPVLDTPLSHPGGYSFPSGHALNVTVATSAVLFMCWPLLPRAARALAVVAAAVLLTAVGLDRVLLGVHFPSDVVAGYILGFGITVTSWIAFVGRTAEISSSASSGRP